MMSDENTRPTPPDEGPPAAPEPGRPAVSQGGPASRQLTISLGPWDTLSDELPHVEGTLRMGELAVVNPAQVVFPVEGASSPGGGITFDARRQMKPAREFSFVNVSDYFTFGKPKPKRKKGGRPKGVSIKPEHREAWLALLVEAHGASEQRRLKPWCKAHKHKWPDGFAHGYTTVREWLVKYAQEIEDAKSTNNPNPLLTVPNDG